MDYRDIGRKIARLRKKLGMTMAELASRVGLSQGQISRLENGKQGLRSATLLRVAAALQVKPVYFFIDDNRHGKDHRQAVYGLLTKGNLLRALESPEFVRLAERLADAFLHGKKNFRAIEIVVDALSQRAAATSATSG